MTQTLLSSLVTKALLFTLGNLFHQNNYPLGVAQSYCKKASGESTLPVP